MTFSSEQWVHSNWANSDLFIQHQPFTAWGFPGGSDGKESPYNVGDLGSIPGLGKLPWRRAWQPTPVFLPGESLWTEEPGGLQFIGVANSWTKLTSQAQQSTFTSTHVWRVHKRLQRARVSEAGDGLMKSMVNRWSWWRPATGGATSSTVIMTTVQSPKQNPQVRFLRGNRFKWFGKRLMPDGKLTPPDYLSIENIFNLKLIFYNHLLLIHLYYITYHVCISIATYVDTYT